MRILGAAWSLMQQPLVLPLIGRISTSWWPVSLAIVRNDKVSVMNSMMQRACRVSFLRTITSCVCLATQNVALSPVRGQRGTRVSCEDWLLEWIGIDDQHVKGQELVYQDQAGSEES
mmetsp:Transcript_42500/g.77129  ORF Transcript_42500/g.77129 Transcript_42500/m.77129 type:complete len:117 (-) Transcript_42500:156-506(-)